MSSLTYLTALSLLALSVAATPPSAAVIAAPPPRGASRGPATAAQFLSLINAARADAGAPPLSWNATVARRAKQHVTWLRDSAGCDLKQTSRDPIRPQMSMIWYQLKGSRRPSAADAVASWLTERPWYDRATGACLAGEECGSYQILVTPKWRQLGCAMVACPSGGGVAVCVYHAGRGGKALE